MTLAEQLRREGHQRGLQQGLEKGLQQGLEKGQLEDARDSILDILEARFNTAPQEIVETLKAVNDISVLKQLRKKAAVTESLEEFRKMVRKAGGLS